jgi:hypothetical protein
MRNKYTNYTVGLMVAVCGALVACNSSQNIGEFHVSGCAAPSGVQVSLVYPAPNSSNVPANFSQVIFGATQALPSSYHAYVQSGLSTSASFQGVQAAPSPLPSPYATPPFANPLYQSSLSDGTTWTANSTVSVYLAQSGAGCVPQEFLGSFSVAATPSPGPTVGAVP